MLDGQTKWDPTHQYLVLLNRQSTPTKEGSEVAWTVVEIGQGVFEGTGTTWANQMTGLSVANPYAEAW